MKSMMCINVLCMNSFGNYLCITLHVTSALLKVVEMRPQMSLVVYV